MRDAREPEPPMTREAETPPAPLTHAGWTIAAFEREPGRWRAVAHRGDAAATTPASADLGGFTTSADAETAADAVRLAQAAIDAGTAC